MTLLSPSVSTVSAPRSQVDQPPSSHSSSHPAKPSLDSDSPIDSPVTMSVRAKERDGSMMSPSLSSILESFAKDGNGDTELLKVLLNAKAKEDERLAALDIFRAEQLRASRLLAWYNTQQQSQHVPLSPYTSGNSPVSPPLVTPPWKEWKDSRPPPYGVAEHRPLAPPPSVQSHVGHPFRFHPNSYQAAASYYGPPPPSRDIPLSPPSVVVSVDARSPSGAAEDKSKRPFADDGAASAKKKQKHDHLSASAGERERSVGATSPIDKATHHEDAMSALRAKCERNKAAASAANAGSKASSSSSSSSSTTISTSSASLPPLFPSRPSAKPTSPRSRTSSSGAVPRAPPPRAVAVVSSIRSTSSSPPLGSRSPPQVVTDSTSSASTGIDGAAGSSLRMLLNAGQAVEESEKSERNKSPTTSSSPVVPLSGENRLPPLRR